MLDLDQKTSALIICFFSNFYAWRTTILRIYDGLYDNIDESIFETMSKCRNIKSTRQINCLLLKRQVIYENVDKY